MDEPLRSHGLLVSPPDLKALVTRTTGGPWRYEDAPQGNDDSDPIVWGRGHRGDEVVVVRHATHADARFIAAARNHFAAFSEGRTAEDLAREAAACIEDNGLRGDALRAYLAAWIAECAASGDLAAMVCGLDLARRRHEKEMQR